MKELIRIQSELKAPKNQYNNFGKYKYRSCEDILEGLKPLLKETNCTIIMSDDVVLCGDRVYVKANAKLINSEGQTVEGNALAREPLAQKGMSDPQITGSASSYARKYALCGLFAIDDTVETDSQDNTQTTAIETIRKLIKTKKVNEVDFLKYFKVDAISQLNYENQQKAIAMLQKK